MNHIGLTACPLILQGPVNTGDFHYSHQSQPSSVYRAQLSNVRGKISEPFHPVQYSQRSSQVAHITIWMENKRLKDKLDTSESVLHNACGDWQNQKIGKQSTPLTLYGILYCSGLTPQQLAFAFSEAQDLFSDDTSNTSLHHPLVISPDVWPFPLLLTSTQLVLSIPVWDPQSCPFKPPQGSWPELTGREHLIQNIVLFLWRAEYTEDTISLLTIQLL